MENKDGCQAHPTLMSAPSIEEAEKHLTTGGGDGNAKKKRRRGKSKRKIMKPFIKVPWQQRRKNTEKISKLNRNQKRISISKTQAPFNNNQFLMEIHKPEPENNFQLPCTPSARTRDSSFSVDSEENYFFSLPEDEEEFLTKEFSSVYEDAQCERLASMSKADLIQEYLLLEAKHEALTKRYDKGKGNRSEKYCSPTEKPEAELDSLDEVMVKLKERDTLIEELKSANEKLRQQNERLRRPCHSSSADSESDSSSTSVSSSSCSSTKGSFEFSVRNQGRIPMITNEQPLVNGFANEDSVGNGEIESDNMELVVNGDISDNVDGLPVRNGHTESENVDNV